MKDELLNLYLDGRLSPEEARRVDQALESDGEVRARFEGLLAAREAVRSAFSLPDDVPAFDEVWAGVEARLDAEVVTSSAPSLAEAWWAWLFRPAVAWAATAALVLAVLAGVWLTQGPTGSPAPAPQVATVAPAPAAPASPGVRRELPLENGRRGMVSEEKSKRSLAIVESYDVELGVVVVSRPSGSAKLPLVIWHLVPGEELDDEEEVMP